MTKDTRAARTALLLNEIRPTWRTEVDADNFKLGDLLRLLGGRQTAIRKLKPLMGDFPSNEKLLQEAGLSSVAHKGAARANERKQLEQAWIPQIKNKTQQTA